MHSHNFPHGNALIYVDIHINRNYFNEGMRSLKCNKHRYIQTDIHTYIHTYIYAVALSNSDVIIDIKNNTQPRPIMNNATHKTKSTSPPSFVGPFDVISPMSTHPKYKTKCKSVNLF